MHTRLVIAFLIFFLVTYVPSAVAQTPATVAETNDAKARGTQIGTVISAAIDTALPGLSSIGSAISKIFTASPKPKQQEAANQVTKTATDAATAQIKSKIQTIAPLETQLNTLAPFIQYGFRASSQISALIEYLSITASPDWAGTVSPMWGDAQKELNLIPFSPRDLDTLVASSDLLDLLQQILEAKGVAADSNGSIDRLIVAKAKDKLLAELTNLNNTLSTLYVVARVQLRSISSQVDVLIKWANDLKASQGVETLPKEVKDDVGTAKSMLVGATKQSQAFKNQFPSVPPG